MPTPLSTLLRAAGLLLALTTAGGRAGLPDQAGAADHPVPARRQQRRGRAPGRDSAERAARQAGRRRQPRRGAGGVVGTEIAANAPAGRLHAADRLARARRQSVALQAAVRSDQSVHARSPFSRRGPNVAGGQSDAAGEFGQGPHRARQGEARPAAIRLGRRRQLPASRRRAVQAHGRRRPPARAVQGRRPGDDRRDRRPHQGHVQLARADARRTSAPASCARWASAAQTRNPVCPTCRRSRKPACPATRPSTGGASSRRPARRPRSSRSCTRNCARCRIAER